MVLERVNLLRMNLLELVDDITNYIYNGNNVDLITIDFSKAFDKIS